MAHANELKSIGRDGPDLFKGVPRRSIKVNVLSTYLSTKMAFFQHFDILHSFLARAACIFLTCW